MTTTIEDIKTSFLSYFEQQAEQISESDDSNSLNAIRQKALEALANEHFPTTRDEEWKYTDVKAILKNSYSNSSVESIEQIPDYREDIDAHLLVFVNGKYSTKLSNIQSDKVKDSILIKPLSQSISDNSEKVAQHFETETVSLFTEMNTAFAQDGILVDVAPNQELELPIMVYFISDKREGNTASHIRNLILVGENSRATIIENYVSVGENTDFTNVLTKIKVERYANLKHLKLQTSENLDFQIGSIHVEQEDNSTFSNTTVSLEGKLIRNDLRIKLGEHCESYMNGIYLLDGKTHVDNHTVVDHQKPNSYSDELYKGVLADKSKGVFNGKIFVRQDAQKTNAFQSNRNILLSDDAIINTKPQLEIWADDVKCTHGATTGRLDEEAMFYLQARGISKSKAKALLLQAFSGEVLDRIDLEPIKAFLEKRIEAKLGI